MNRVTLIAKNGRKVRLEQEAGRACAHGVHRFRNGALKEGDKVQLMGFGTFEIKERSARTGRNPSTGETIEIPASKIPAFKPGKVLREEF